MNLKEIELREYQKNIANTCLKGNTLVVLPTGLGKTVIAIYVALKRLEQNPTGKILFMAPTRPLNEQHYKSFLKFTDMTQEDIALVTGKVRPDDRKIFYEKCRVIIATPQTIANDLKSGRIDLRDFVLAVFDEAHRAVKEYSYTEVAKNFILQSKSPLIIGLTASPGGEEERIKEVIENLFIKFVEIRTENDPDVRPYVKEVEKEYVNVDLPDELEDVRKKLYDIYDEILEWLKSKMFITSKNVTKKELLNLQNSLIAAYDRGMENPINIWGLIKVSQAIKVLYLIELLETQDIKIFSSYVKELYSSKKRAEKILASHGKFLEIYKKLPILEEKYKVHPKMEKLVDIVKNLIKGNQNVRIIVFANLRETVERIVNVLRENGISAEMLIGQAKKGGKGLSQKEQIEIVKRFASNEFNVLVCSSIGEEGLDISSVNYAIFYEAVPSEIRLIQRRGRIGRQSEGKVIFLLTKKSIDEGYFFSSLSKEKKMKKTLRRIKNDGLKKRKLSDWV
ncbi:MAG: DEAD/DEAH box helicase family protein [Candidatus Aenigmarchaeota archaeon]|nr:DEAD/DEAH box helicase family protein [Candidatus Aenigmarchaeota archaeon]MCX8190716.1 DEAD/DEAH box helicase family protein [Candidatus Aenigmarchaeota archaeon]MDW8159964.1 DEAD/DEAH box helicase family protein [Candidatus Aenigmarchaeota archaeon]